MDDNAQSFNHSSSKKNVSVDPKEAANSISNVYNAGRIHNGTSYPMKMHKRRKTMYAFFFLYQVRSPLLFSRRYWSWLTLNLITNPVFTFWMLFSIAMLIGILVICFTAPSQPGMSFPFYILRIEHSKTPK